MTQDFLSSDNVHESLMKKYGRDKEFRSWGMKMPPLSFKPEWLVTIIPPFGGAAARFTVKKGASWVSVYADFDGSLGSVDDPYWEIYPFQGATFRCGINETRALMEAISASLAEQVLK